MQTQKLLARLDQLLAIAASVLATEHRTDFGMRVDSGQMKGFRAGALSFIDRVYGNEHPIYKEFEGNTRDYRPSDVTEGVGILKAMRLEIEGGWLQSVREIVTAEVFADFLEMADHLLVNRYKDPAAVIAGGVLEEHLRQLCLKNDVDIEEDRDGKVVKKKADKLNSDLAKKEIYSKLDQKQITAWLDLRNKAAHGEYAQYSHEQVDAFLKGITEFMVRVRA